MPVECDEFMGQTWVNLSKLQIMNNRFHLGENKPAPISDMIACARGIRNVRYAGSIFEKDVFAYKMRNLCINSLSLSRLLTAEKRARNCLRSVQIKKNIPFEKNQNSRC